MTIADTTISKVMRELGKRKKHMSEAAIKQRQEAAKKSALARKQQKLNESVSSASNVSQ